ncbi:MAG TPA: WYL domain-containing protein [Blastocatellia bacterium]|nr:WYL domain-containing protein [Blastocatellia bacterium]
MKREHHREYERFLWIEAEIRRGRYPNTRTIAEHFEVSRKTVQRTIEFMRDRFQAPLDYSAAHRGWYYTEPTFVLPAEILTEGDIVAILMAERLARQYAGSILGAQVGRALSKVAGALTETVSVDLSELSAAWSFEALPTIEVDETMFHELVRATREHLSVEMTYFTAMTGETGTRRVDPLHVRNHQGDWYLVAFDHKRKEVRIFLLGRIRELTVLDTKFTPRKGFDLAAFLESSFQMFVGSEPIDVVLEFDAYQARWIRERRLPHDSAWIEELDDGGVRLSMRVLSIEAVRRYILQYGSHVRVVAPQALCDEIRTEAERMAAMYVAPAR